MPTPHGTRGGMAFSSDELHVLRHALARALNPPSALGEAVPAPAPDPDLVRDFLRLVEGIDEAAREAGRERVFLLEELARYRGALPGSASGYLARLEAALDTGYNPLPEDRKALRGLLAAPCAPAERARRTRLLHRCRPALATRATVHPLAPARAAREERALTAALGRSRTPTPAELWNPRSAV